MRTKFDRFAKETWSALCERAGRVETQVEVSADTHYVDLVFEPDAARVEALRPFGLVPRMLGQGHPLVEFFHDPPSVDSVLRCLTKHIERGWKLQTGESSRMWIVTAGRPSTALARLGFIRDEAWPVGTYRLPDGFSTNLIVVSELPVRRDTLMLRVLGSGDVLRAALAEVAALPDGAPERGVVLPVVVRLLGTSKYESSEDDEEFRMATDEFVQEWERKLREQGRDEGSAKARREDLIVILRARFGELDARTLANVAAAPKDALAQWIERAITANRLSDVFEPPG